MEHQSAYNLGVLIGSLVVGILCGSAPLIFGFIKKRITTGIIGFVCCLIGGLILGIILALPLAIIFSIVINRKKDDTDNFTAPPNPPTFTE